MKPILIQHGEKLLVAIILVLCVVMVNGTLADSATQPNAQATPEKVAALLNAIERRRSSAAPQPDQPFDYTGSIRNRLSARVETIPTLQWLFAHPDIIIGNVGVTQVFTAYEVFAPELSVIDDVGSITISVALPQAEQKTARGVAGGAQWLEADRVSATGEKIRNAASWLGLRLEYRIGAGDWTPLVTAGGSAAGYYLFADGVSETKDIVLSGVQGEQRYEFRGQLLVKATGIVERGAPVIGCEVIVYNGACASPSRAAWRTINGKVQGRLMPVAAEKVPQGVQLAEREHAYLSALSTIAAIEKTESDVIIALKSVSALPGQPMKARILMRKKVRNSLGTILGWTDQVEFKDIEVGSKIGIPTKVSPGVDPHKVVVAVDGKKRAVDFRTEWTVKSIQMDAVRTLYYEVKKEALEGGAVKLVLKPKVFPSYQLVTLSNSNGDEIVLPKLKRISIQERKMPYVYPQLVNGGAKHDEVAAFHTGDPADFRNPEMLPVTPVSHAPADLVNYDPEAETSVDFYVFADNRYVYYDHLAKKLRAVDIVVEEPVVGEEGMSEPVEEEQMGE